MRAFQAAFLAWGAIQILAPQTFADSGKFFDVESIDGSVSRDHEVKTFDLDGLIDFAKKNNEIFSAARQDIEIARQDLVTAGLFANPQIFYSQTFMGGTPSQQSGSPEYAPGISFELDLAMKRGLRKEVAEKGVTIEKFNFLDFERLFKLQIKQTYRELLLVQEQARYKKEFFSTYLTLMKASRIRAQKGDISGIEYDRLDLERIGYEADVHATEIQWIDVSQRMRRLLGLPPLGRPLAIKGSLVFTPLSQLEPVRHKMLLDRRPDIAALITRADQSESLISLRRREVIPTLTLSGEYRKKAEEGYFGFSVMMPLPVFNRNQGEIARAEELTKKFRLQARIKRREVTGEVQAKLREVLTREEILLKYQELGLLEKNRQVAERSRIAYLKKAFSIVALLESQRNYIYVQKNYFELLYLYFTAIDSFLASVEGTST